MKIKQFNFRIDDDDLNNLIMLAKNESKRTGYKINKADIVRVAIKQFLEKNK